MKLKYYLRGMGIGIILTAIVMGFALGGRKATLSDAEIIQRAKVLGMVEGNNGVLTQTQEGAASKDENDTSASNQTLDKEGSPVFEEVKQEVTGADNNVSEVEKKETERSAEATEIVEAGEQASNRVEEAYVAQERPADNASETRSTTDTVSEGRVTQSIVSTDNGTAEISTEETVRDSASEASTAQDTVKSEEVATTREADTNEEAAAAATTESTTSASSGSKTVTIPGGLSSDQVAQILYKEGLVDDAVTFNRYLIDKGMDRVIRSGVKTFPEGASYDQIAGIITKG